jgi:hypothetical protein
VLFCAVLEKNLPIDGPILLSFLKYSWEDQIALSQGQLTTPENDGWETEIMTRNFGEVDWNLNLKCCEENQQTSRRSRMLTLIPWEQMSEGLMSKRHSSADRGETDDQRTYSEDNATKEIAESDNSTPELGDHTPFAGVVIEVTPTEETKATVPNVQPTARARETSLVSTRTCHSWIQSLRSSNSSFGFMKDLNRRTKLLRDSLASEVSRKSSSSWLGRYWDHEAQVLGVDRLSEDFSRTSIVSDDQSNRLSKDSMPKLSSVVTVVGPQTRERIPLPVF